MKKIIEKPSAHAEQPVLNQDIEDEINRLLSVRRLNLDASSDGGEIDSAPEELTRESLVDLPKRVDSARLDRWSEVTWVKSRYDKFVSFLAAKQEELTKQGSPLTLNEYNAYLHRVKKELGHRARALAKKMNGYGEQIANARKKHQNFGGNQELDAAQSILDMKNPEWRQANSERRSREFRRVNEETIKENTKKRREKIEEVEQFVSETRTKFDLGTDIFISRTKELFGDVGNVETLKKYRDLFESQEDVQRIVKEISLLNKNIELCHHPKMKGLFFKKPVLLNDQGLEYEVALDSLEGKKQNFEATKKMLTKELDSILVLFSREATEDVLRKEVADLYKVFGDIRFTLEKVLLRSKDEGSFESEIRSIDYREIIKKLEPVIGRFVMDKFRDVRYYSNFSPKIKKILVDLLSLTESSEDLSRAVSGFTQTNVSRYFQDLSREMIAASV